MKTILFLSILFLSGTRQEPAVNRQEARSAFSFLNSIRENPQAFTEKFPFLKKLKGCAVLKWNDTLAKVAEAKAMDLAKRNYFGHVDPDGNGMNYFINKAGYTLNSDWLKTRSENYFESLGAGAASGNEAISNLLIDANTPSLGHRIHLLGLDDWNGSLTDIGIGYVVADGKSTYISYMCVLIAKHNW
jgi:uncharacterized protein YkwD